MLVIKNAASLIIYIAIAITTWFVTIIIISYAAFELNLAETHPFFFLFAILILPVVIAILVPYLMHNKQYIPNVMENMIQDTKKLIFNTRIKNIQKNLFEQINIHRHALLRNYRMAVNTNDYGAVVNDNRENIIIEFLNSIGFVSASYFTTDDAVDFVIWEIENYQDDADGRFDPENIPSDGHMFEFWVADSLRLYGWDADVTTGSGDQGIDVIAQKDGYKIGIQCKLYSQPVGNKAVQEAIAGRHYYSLKYAAVITNASFTKSASNLASKASILLLSQYDIPRLENLVQSQKPTL